MILHADTRYRNPEPLHRRVLRDTEAGELFRCVLATSHDRWEHAKARKRLMEHVAGRPPVEAA